MVQGLNDLNKKIAAIPKRIEKAAKAAMEKGAQELVDMMKRLVPVDDGDLRDSIGWTWGSAPAGAKVISQSGSDDRGLKITIYAGSEKAYYAAWVEFGTAQHTNGGQFPGTANPGTTARPFFFPLLVSTRN